LRRRIAALICTAFGLVAASAWAATPEDPFDLAALRGKVVYVDFWASWCVPCRQSFPWMNDIQAEFAPDGLVVVAVNVDQERSDAQDFLRRFPASFRVAYDPAGRLAQQFRLRGMPSSFLIDRGGNVVAVHTGFRPEDRASLHAQIRGALANR
jgi:thiol-disulfide isomerase/thioredoxin